MQIQKLPFYDIPDLTNFPLKPYIEWKTPKVPADILVRKQMKLNPEIMEEIGKQFEKEGLKKEFDKLYKFYKNYRPK